MAEVPTKLRKLKIDRVDLCERGANPDAHIMLFKSADGKHAVDIKKVQETCEVIATTQYADHVDRILKMAGMMMGEAMDFDQMMQEKKMQDKMYKVSEQIWEYINCLRNSVMSIVEHGVGKGEPADGKMKSALEQFKAQMEAATPAWMQHEEMSDDMDDELNVKTGDMRKSVTKFMGYIDEEVGKMPVDRSKLSDEVRQLIEGLEAKVEKYEEKVEKARTHTENYDELVAKGAVAEKKIQELEAQIAKGNVDPEEEFKKALPESVRKRLEESETRAKRAEELIAKHEDKVRTEQYIAKANGYANLSIKADEFGPVLKAIADKVDESSYNMLETVLAAADAQIKAGNLFKQQSGTGGNVGEGDAYEKIANKARELMKSDTKLTFEKAFTKIVETEPALYEEYTKEGVN